MKTLKPQKRSTSPFGFLPPEHDPLSPLKDSFAFVFGPTESEKKPELKHWDDGRYVPEFLSGIKKAPANEAKGLSELCQFLVKYRENLEENTLGDVTYRAMMNLFFEKTSIFLVDHHDKEACEKNEWDDLHRDIVLFRKERDMLVGQFFAPYSEKKPGEFSGFIEEWTQSENYDRILHFVDFCSGSKNPTFEYYLLFTHPTLARWVQNKSKIAGLLNKADPLIKRLASPTFETDLRKTLEI